jgi:invasion protein IalB
MKTKWILSLVLPISLMFGAPVSAQENSTAKVDESVDWDVFAETNPKQCWAVSIPKETVNTRNGRVVAVRRGDIALMVVYDPKAKVNGQIVFTGGYPFAPDSTVDMTIDGNKFALYTKDEWAWANQGEDAKIITAMKKGSKAKLTARSSRGTRTEDTFSLLGFTAAVEDADKRCK